MLSENSILRPAFNRNTSSYQATVAATASTVTLTISNPASMTHNQSGSAADGTPLAVGKSGDEPYDEWYIAKIGDIRWAAERQ